MNFNTVFATALAVAVLAPGAAAQCDANFQISQEMAPLITQAFTAIKAKDVPTLTKLLPSLDVKLGTLPAKEIKAEVCNGNHINAYTAYQASELWFMRLHSIDNGFPTNLPIVRQPTLNQGPLAYAVGWTKYEQGNFEGALAAYAKGLAMFPHDGDLQNEYIATLMQLNRNADVIDFIDGIVGSPSVFTDETLGKLYSSLAIAQFNTDQLEDADVSFTASLNYSSNDNVRNMQQQLRDQMAKNGGAKAGNKSRKN